MIQFAMGMVWGIAAGLVLGSYAAYRYLTAPDEDFDDLDQDWL